MEDFHRVVHGVVELVEDGEEHLVSLGVWLAVVVVSERRGVRLFLGYGVDDSGVVPWVAVF